MGRTQTSRAVAVGGLLHWRYDRRARAWRAVTKPRLKIEAVMMSAGRNRTRLVWKLSSTGETFRDYFEAMLAAEGIPAHAWQDVAVDRARRTRRTR